MGALTVYTPAYDQVAKRWHHFSPTVLQAFSDCRRLPLYDKILRLPKKRFKAQELGVKMHAQLEHHGKTGQDVLEPRLRPLLPYLARDPRCEHAEFEVGLDGFPRTEGRPYDYGIAPTIAGVPVEGYVDRLEWGMDAARVTDYKTTKDIAAWAKTPEQLRRDLQLGIYSEWIRRRARLPRDVGVTARHLYAQTEGPVDGREVAVRLSVADLAETWANAESLGSGLLKLQGADSDDGVEPTGIARGHCQKYGGCSFAATCLRTPRAMLRQRVQMAAAREARNEKLPDASVAAQGEQDMSSFFERVKSKNNGAAVPPPAAAAIAPAVAAAPAAPQGQAAYGTQEQVTPPAPPAQVAPPAPQGDPDVPPGGRCEMTPTGAKVVYDQGGAVVKVVQPAAAQALAAARLPIQDKSTTPDDVLREQQRKGILPPDAPPNDASATVEKKPKRGGKKTDANDYVDHPAVKQLIPTGGGLQVSPNGQTLLVFDTGGNLKGQLPLPLPAIVSPAVTAGTAAPAAATATAATTAPPAGAPARAEVAAAAPGQAGAVLPPPQPTKAGEKLPIQLFVNCIPVGLAFTHLDEYAARKARETADALQVEDFRLTDLGAIKGKGGLAAMIRAEPPPAGTYVAISSSFDGPLAVAVETLIPLAEVVVRGVR